MSTARISGQFLIALAFAPLLMGGACEKKQPANPADTGAITALDHTGSAEKGPPATTIDTAPLQGIDLGKLDKDKQQAFYRMISTLKSPCDKPQSLRDSYIKDASCKRAPFAVRYVVAMLEDEFPEDKAREEYSAKYDSPRAFKLDTSKAPRVGPDDAAVKIVEFYDYGCPHCKEHYPVFEALAQQYDGKIAEYFMMFPLGHWPDSKSAAQAAIAAYQQGKFREMHAMLFNKAPAHSKDNVMEMAAALKLDLPKFEAAYNAAAPQVELDKAQGDSAGVDSTPTVYFNNRKYSGPITMKYLSLWIDEEMAVNR